MRFALLLAAIGLLPGLVSGQSKSTLKKLSDDEAREVEACETRACELLLGEHWVEAVKEFRKALDLRTQVLGTDHPETLKFRATVENLQRVSRLSAKDRADYLEAMKLEIAFRRLERQGKLADAQATLQKVLDARRRLLGEDNAETARTYTDLARLLRETGRFGEAEAHFRTALRGFQRALGACHPDTANTHAALALAIARQGDKSRAESALREALDQCLKAVDKDELCVSLVANRLAPFLQEQGKYAQAEALFRLALMGSRRFNGEEDSVTVTAYGNLAYVLALRGDYSAALALLRSALRASQTRACDRNDESDECHVALCAVLVSQGRLSEAETLFRSLLPRVRLVRGEEHANTISCQMAFGTCLAAQGRTEEALPVVRQGVVLLRRVLGRQHTETQSAENLLLYLLFKNGQTAEAEKLAQVHLSLGQNGRSDAAPDLNEKATLLYWEGKYAEVEALLRQELKSLHELVGEDAEITSETTEHLALALSAQGKVAEAEALMAAAARNFSLACLADDLTNPLQTAHVLAQYPRLYLTLLLAGQSKARAAWDCAEEFWHCDLLDRHTAMLLRASTSDARCRQQEIQKQLVILGEQRRVCTGKPAALKSGQEQLQKLLRQRSALLNELAKLDKNVVLPLERIQAQLPADAALVAWIDQWPTSPKQQQTREHWACILRRQGSPRWAQLPGSAPDGCWSIDDQWLSQELRDALNQPPGEDTDAVPELAKRLRAQRFTPLLPHLDGIKHLIVLPAGWMAGVPVELLTDTHLVSYAPSATWFARLRASREARKAKPTAIEKLLAVADPVPNRPLVPPLPPLPDHGLLVHSVNADGIAKRNDIEAGDVLLSYAGKRLNHVKDLQPAEGKDEVALKVWRSGSTRELKAPPDDLGVRFDPRPAAQAIREERAAADVLALLEYGPGPMDLIYREKEVEAVARLFPKADVLLGATAGEKPLDELAQTDRLRQYQVLHLAVPGALDRLAGWRCALTLSRDPFHDPVAAAREGKRVYDGRLDGAEIAETWQLDADLVTLSGCAPLVGPRTAMDGYLGLAQILLKKGARSVLVSLWRTEDKVATRLMERFYQNWLQGGMKKAEALREAKAWLQKSHPHPHDWAGFVLIGDPE